MFYNKVIRLMEGKLKKQDLLKVITQMEIIEKLPKQLLEQLCKIFKVEEISAPHSRLIQHFKNKMVDIFMQEADGYMDYLQLPKFRSLGPEFTEKMHLLFRNVWNQYGESKLREQANITKKQIQQLTPSFESPEKMQQFHLRLLQIYRESSICPKNTRISSKPIQQRKVIPQQAENNNFLYQNPNLGVGQLNSNINGTMQSPLFPLFPFTQTPNYPKVQAQDGIPYILDNKNHNQQPMFDMSRFQPYFPNADMFQINNRVQEKIQEPPKNIFSQNLQSSLTNFIRYEYIQCVCQGKRGIQDKIGFQCSVCNFSYHLYCLKMQSNPANNSICPLCILRKQTVFCKVISQPIKFNWHLGQRGKELKVQMTDQQSNQIYQARRKGKNCQIRFLKINGKSFKKDRKPFQGYTNFNGHLQKPAKHTQITLPELADDRNQKISIEIVLRSEDDQQPNIPKLYLFAVFFISTKQIDNIVDDLFSNTSTNFTTREFYQPFMKDQKGVSINLQGENSARGQVRYPVRGDLCNHLDVFDLKKFLQIVSDLKKDNDSQLNCPICSNLCNYFLYDRQIYNAIQNFPEYNQKKPQGIFIDKSGETFWIGDNDQDNDSVESMQIQNQGAGQQGDEAMQ